MPFKFDADNNLLTTGISISGGNAAAGPTGLPVPVDADYQGVKVGVNLVGVTGFTVGSSTAEAVAIVDGSGNQITSFGGGTQFADNAASGATPTGTLEMGWDSANSKVRALKVDASQNLNVNIAASAGTVTVGQATGTNLHTVVDSGSITANIGTTGGLALDTSLTTIDTDIKATQPRDITDRSARLLGHVTVDSMPGVSVSASSAIDEYGNKIEVSEFVEPWRQALLDEMRAVRIGIQLLCEYLNPASGVPFTTNFASGLRASIIPTTLLSNEADLLGLAQNIREGSEEVIN